MKKTSLLILCVLFSMYLIINTSATEIGNLTAGDNSDYSYESVDDNNTGSSVIDFNDHNIVNQEGMVQEFEIEVNSDTVVNQISIEDDDYNSAPPTKIVVH